MAYNTPFPHDAGIKRKQNKKKTGIEEVATKEAGVKEAEVKEIGIKVVETKK